MGQQSNDKAVKQQDNDEMWQSNDELWWGNETTMRQQDNKAMRVTKWRGSDKAKRQRWNDEATRGGNKLKQ
jgi:hypothetical protein